MKSSPIMNHGIIRRSPVLCLLALAAGLTTPGPVTASDCIETEVLGDGLDNDCDGGHDQPVIPAESGIVITRVFGGIYKASPDDAPDTSHPSGNYHASFPMSSVRSPGGSLQVCGYIFDQQLDDNGTYEQPDGMPAVNFEQTVDGAVSSLPAGEKLWAVDLTGACDESDAPSECADLQPIVAPGAGPTTWYDLAQMGDTPVQAFCYAVSNTEADAGDIAGAFVTVPVAPSERAAAPLYLSAASQETIGQGYSDIDDGGGGALDAMYAYLDNHTLDSFNLIAFFEHAINVELSSDDFLDVVVRMGPDSDPTVFDRFIDLISINEEVWVRIRYIPDTLTMALDDLNLDTDATGPEVELEASFWEGEAVFEFSFCSDSDDSQQSDACDPYYTYSYDDAFSDCREAAIIACTHIYPEPDNCDELGQDPSVIAECEDYASAYPVDPTPEELVFPNVNWSMVRLRFDAEDLTTDLGLLINQNSDGQHFLEVALEALTADYLSYVVQEHHYTADYDECDEWFDGCFDDVEDDMVQTILGLEGAAWLFVGGNLIDLPLIGDGIQSATGDTEFSVEWDLDDSSDAAYALTSLYNYDYGAVLGGNFTWDLPALAEWALVAPFTYSDNDGAGDFQRSLTLSGAVRPPLASDALSVSIDDAPDGVDLIALGDLGAANDALAYYAQDLTTWATDALVDALQDAGLSAEDASIQLTAPPHVLPENGGLLIQWPNVIVRFEEEANLPGLERVCEGGVRPRDCEWVLVSTTETITREFAIDLSGEAVVSVEGDGDTQRVEITTLNLAITRVQELNRAELLADVAPLDLEGAQWGSVLTSLEISLERGLEELSTLLTDFLQSYIPCGVIEFDSATVNDQDLLELSGDYIFDEDAAQGCLLDLGL